MHPVSCNNTYQDVTKFGKSSSSEKCPNTEIFLVRIFCIWTEYGDLLGNSAYSVQIRENTDHKKLSIWTLLTQRMTWFKIQKLEFLEKGT